MTGKAINKIKEIATKTIPEGGEAYLYGSRARGTAHRHSDWDILILLDKDRLEQLSLRPTGLRPARRNQPHHVHQKRMGFVPHHTFLRKRNTRGDTNSLMP